MISNVSLEKNYSLIGRVLCLTRPEVVSEVMQTVLIPGDVVDLSLINSFYDHFVLKVDRVTRRRVFTAAMLKLYHPGMLISGVVKVKYGFTKAIADCFSCSLPMISRNVTEATVLYKAYDDFRTQVNEFVEKIKPVKDEKEKN